jgi:adenylyltransferase/sulfurtransferase
MNDQQLLRYSRHILLEEIGIEGQQRLLDATALVIGLGGLGSPAGLYLAASGVGRLLLCDHDTVDQGNLQRQIIHRTPAIGQPKVASAQATLQELNPGVECIAIPQRAEGQELQALIGRADVVLDCSDNFATRYAVNRACHGLRKPLVSGAAVKFHGHVSVHDFRAADTPCYDCLFPENDASAELRCATTGVFAPLVGIIGSLQAAEALKLLTGSGRGLNGSLLSLDAHDMNVIRTKCRKDPACNTCSPAAAPQPAVFGSLARGACHV